MTNNKTRIAKITNSSYWRSFSSVILRFGLGAGFLSAVADRLGLWGAFGQPNVEWGDFSRFLEYTAVLNWFVPAGMIPLLGVIATGVETLLGVLLIVGWHTRVTAILTALLLLTFASAMTLSLGIKAPLNFAVFTGVGGALLLASCRSFPFTVDQLLLRRRNLAEPERRQHDPSHIDITQMSLCMSLKEASLLKCKAEAPGQFVKATPFTNHQRIYTA